MQTSSRPLESRSIVLAAAVVLALAEGASMEKIKAYFGS